MVAAAAQRVAVLFGVSLVTRVQYSEYSADSSIAHSNETMASIDRTLRMSPPNASYTIVVDPERAFVLGGDGALLLVLALAPLLPVSPCQR